VHRLQIRPINSAQLYGTPYHSSKLHPDPCSSVGMRRRTVTQTRVTNIHFASATPHAKCNDLPQFATLLGGETDVVTRGPAALHLCKSSIF